MRLSQRDFDLLQRTLLELYQFRELEAFRRVVPQLFFKLVPSNHFIFITYDINSCNGCVKTIDCLESQPRVTPEALSQWERRFWEHPFAKYFAEARAPTALMFSDFFTSIQLRNTPFWELVCKIFECDRVVSLPLMTAAGMSSVSLARHATHFTERDRLILNLLRPHFSRAQRNAELATTRGSKAGPPLAAYGLLPREIEVAHWVGQGKTNPEIAMILKLSPRTVEKHLERILAKLGVENRAAAAVMISKAGKPEIANHAPFPLRL